MSNLTSFRNVGALRNDYRLIVYDLDGTLLETLADLAEAIGRAFAQRGHPPVTHHDVRAAIGDGARSLIQRLLPKDHGPSELDASLDAFKIAYLETCRTHSHWLPGACQFLDNRSRELPQRRQAILTNKPQAPTDLLVEHLQMNRWISRAIGGDTSLGKKPDPRALLELMHWAQAQPSETLMIGDGPADLEVAHAAGVDGILLEGGYGQPQELLGLECLVRVKDLIALDGLWPKEDLGT